MTPTSRRRSVLRLAMVLALAAPAAAACGIRPTGITALGPAPAALTGSPARSANGTAGSTQFPVYFYQGDRLTAVYRSTDAAITEDVVLRALISGPDPAEEKAGISSEVPTDLHVETQAGGLADAYAVDEVLTSRAKAQFVCTMQNFDETGSIGIQTAGAATLNWNACSDTTGQYIPMRADQTPR